MFLWQILADRTANLRLLESYVPETSKGPPQPGFWKPTAKAKAKAQSADKDTQRKGFGSRVSKRKAPAATRRGGSQQEKLWTRQIGERGPLNFIDFELTRLGVSRRTLKMKLAAKGFSPDDCSAAVGLWNEKALGGPSIVDIISTANASPSVKRAALFLGPTLVQLRREAGDPTLAAASGAPGTAGGSDAWNGDVAWANGQSSGTEDSAVADQSEPQQADAAPKGDRRETLAGATDRIGRALAEWEHAEPQCDRPEGWERTKASDRWAARLHANGYLIVSCTDVHRPCAQAAGNRICLQQCAAKRSPHVMPFIRQLSPRAFQHVLWVVEGRRCWSDGRNAVKRMSLHLCRVICMRSRPLLPGRQQRQAWRTSRLWQRSPRESLLGLAISA